MTRLPTRPGTGRLQNNSARSKFRKHKVILESVTQRRKKLRTVISFEVNAPPGYTFIPAGNPRFTTACKETCREQGLKVFTVTTTPHQNTHGLSQQVHRVGYHFPSTIVADECMEHGLYLSENGNVVPFERFGTKNPTVDGDADVSQITINTEARDVIRDLFPEIPDEDMNQIIKTAFQKGQRKVGTAVELPLARRAQLAVVAHIRHIYTEYDKLLKKTSFQEARRSVEDSTLEKLVQWRGDDESGMPELEDVFREVIVISDDEEEDTEDTEDTEDSDLAEHGKFTPDDQDFSVQILPTHVVADKLDVIAADESNHSVSFFPIKVSRKPLLSEDSTRTGTMSLASARSKVDRRGFSRYQAWDRAMDRYREKKLHRHDEINLSRGSMIPREDTNLSSKLSYTHSNQGTGRPLTPIVERIFDNTFKSTTHDMRPHSSDIFHHKSPYDSQDGSRVPTSFSPKRKAPDILHFRDGSVFGKISTATTSHKRVSYPTDVSSAPVFVAGPRIFSEDGNTLKRVHPSIHTGESSDRVDDTSRNNTIIPSIEHQESTPPTRFPLQHRGNNPSISSTVGIGTSAIHNRQPLDELSKGIDLIDLTEDTQNFSKRRRLESQEVPRESYYHPSHRDNVLYSNSRGSEPQPAPFTHSRNYETMSEDSISNRGSFVRKDQVPIIINGTREETNQVLYRPEDILRGSSGAIPGRPTILIDAPEKYNRTSMPTLTHPVGDALPQYRDSMMPQSDSYIIEVPREKHLRVDRPVSSYHSRSSASDDAVWRNKANSYRSQRRLLEAQDPSWSTGVSQSSLYRSRPQRIERVTHSPAHNQEDIVDQPVHFSVDTRIENVYSYSGTQKRRVSSQPPVMDGQRKRDTLPISAMRRYEVQLEKSMNPYRHESAPYQERQG